MQLSELPEDPEPSSSLGPCILCIIRLQLLASLAGCALIYLFQWPTGIPAPVPGLVPGWHFHPGPGHTLQIGRDFVAGIPAAGPRSGAGIAF